MASMGGTGKGGASRYGLGCSELPVGSREEKLSFLSGTCLGVIRCLMARTVAGADSALVGWH